MVQVYLLHKNQQLSVQRLTDCNVLSNFREGLQIVSTVLRKRDYNQNYLLKSINQGKEYIYWLNNNSTFLWYLDYLKEHFYELVYRYGIDRVIKYETTKRFFKIYNEFYNVCLIQGNISKIPDKIVFRCNEEFKKESKVIYENNNEFVNIDQGIEMYMRYYNFKYKSFTEAKKKYTKREIPEFVLYNFDNETILI